MILCCKIECFKKKKKKIIWRQRCQCVVSYIKGIYDTCTANKMFVKYFMVN
jgi:hypothetical protein